MKFQVEWQEWVYDAFDELENIWDRPPFEIDIQPDFFGRIEQIAEREASHQIEKSRDKKSRAHGTFIPKIIALIKKNGVRCQIQKKSEIRGNLVVEVE